jgi:D-sedoheptulose 7-phosphate isomerase
MKNNRFYNQYFEAIYQNLLALDNIDFVDSENMILDAYSKNKKIILAGNGGSAAIASHVSVDLTKAGGIRAINFNESDLITCFANDYGYENWISKAIECYADPEDLVILISSSGQSPNIINAANKAKEINLPLITLSGFLENNPLRKIGTVNFWVNSSEYNIVEMAHNIILLSILDSLIARNKICRE